MRGMCLFLPDVRLEELDVALVGGKAFGLRWLQSHGVRVPPTWVITTEAFTAMLEAANVSTHVAALERAVANQPDWAGTEIALQGLADVLGELAEALRTTPLPAPVQRALQALSRSNVQWAVRSSATVEDQAAHSFAGQFRSFLSVPGGAPLAEAVRGVWRSAFSKSVLHYRAANGTAMPRMAVLLQPMSPITARDRAGVAFSRSSIPGLSGVLIQSTFGSGNTVVDGGGGELKCVSGTSAVTTHLQPAAQIMITAAGGGLQPVPAQGGEAIVLTDAEALRLARMLQEIAPQYGCPVDIEFIWREGEDPEFLQVRAITR
jgi:phosphoenolpyruvate synthase/pyruvate phosphate dikinase